tara:strand:+ start:983 stop:1255 length:273 start_codon:yes stop_codon:yes gene_type:complete
MSKKIVKLKSKKEVEIVEMSIDDIDYCNDVAVLRNDDSGNSYITGLAKSRTAWLRKGLSGEVTDKVLKSFSDDEKNELVILIQKHQELGE